MKHLKKGLILKTISIVLPFSVTAQNQDHEEPPNILWIYLEDTAPFFSCYGEQLIETPNVDNLAKNGVMYTNAYMSAPVSSPCRSGIITGAMATSNGLHNHHSSRTNESAIYLPDYWKTIPELFKEKGYFTFNNGKDDYNFSYNRQELYDQNYFEHPLYGKSGERIPTGEFKNKQPFFGQIQLYGGKEIFSATFKEKVKHPVDRSKIKLPPFLPDHPAIIEEYANHLDAIQITDERVGEIVKELKNAGILNNTIVFFFSDHGMRLIRHKQFLYDTGIHVPLIISDFRKNKLLPAGITNSDLISGIDIGISSLCIAGIEVPEYMEGKNFFDRSKRSREYIIAARDRCDFSIDRIRALRTHNFKYIKNYIPDRPYMQTNYMDVDGVEFMKVMRQLHQVGSLNKDQDRFFAHRKPMEELYDLRTDPYELHNLANEERYKEVKERLANLLNEWIAKTDDQGQYPESKEGLKLMLGIWGKHASNSEYDKLRKEFPDLEGSLFHLKSSGWKKVKKDSR